MSQITAAKPRSTHHISRPKDQEGFSISQFPSGGKHSSASPTSKSHHTSRHHVRETGSVFSHLQQAVIFSGRHEMTIGSDSIENSNIGGSSIPTSSNTVKFGKIRTLDEYLKKFPIDNPSMAAPLVLPKSNINEMQQYNTKRNKHINLEREIRKYETDARRKKAGKQAAIMTFSNFRKQKIETWLTIAERNNQKMRKENKALSKLSLLAQENCIDNDEKYSQALQDMRRDLELATLVRQDDSTAIKNINSKVELIQLSIDDVCDSTKEAVKEEYKNLKDAFEAQVERQAKKLDNVRESGKTTCQEWREKNETVQQELLMYLEMMEKLHEEKRKLEKLNQKLRVKYDSHSGDDELLNISFRKEKNRNIRAKAHLQAIEMELSAATATKNRNESCAKETTPGPSITISNDEHFGDAMADEEVIRRERRQQQYNRALESAKDSLEIELENLRGLRIAHVSALNARTELEMFLRQSLFLQRQCKEQRIKDGFQSKLFTTPSENILGMEAPLLGVTRSSPELVFDANDRCQILERMLSNKHVINLLYDESNGIDDMERLHEEDGVTAHHPYSQQSGAVPTANRTIRAIPTISALHTNEEVETLWNKWKQWTERANEMMSLASNVTDCDNNTL